MSDNTFSYTLGAGGVATGSKGVITINMNRLIQTAVADGRDICEAVREQVKDIHVYLKAWNAILKDEFNAKLLPIYNAGYISLDKQFLTIGINGFVEAVNSLATPSPRTTKTMLILRTKCSRSSMTRTRQIALTALCLIQNMSPLKTLVSRTQSGISRMAS